MPNYTRKRSYVLPLVAVAVVAAPVAAGFLGGDGQYRFSNDSETDRLRPTATTQIGLAGAPRVVLPLRELAGMQLPDLKVADLRLVPGAPPLPEGSRVGPIGFVTDEGTAPISARTPALDPGVVPEHLADRVGAQVTELTNGSRFSMVGLTAPDLAGVTAMVRARQLDGSWGPWFEAGTDDSVSARRPGSGRMQGSEPVYVGDTDAVQILSTRKLTDTAEPGSRGPAPVAGPDHFGLAVPEMSAVLLDPGRSEENLSAIAAPLAGGGPRVISRAQWGADESIRCEDPTYDDGLGGIVVHHTAGRNDYSKAESAAIVRGIYAYHAETLGWCDIGYHALVDKYGQIFEGHFGGLDEPVQGAHTGGFNENTAGVAFMGNHESEDPTQAAITAMGQFVGWRARVAGLDPRGTTTMISEGTEFTPYGEGEQVQLPVVFSHRDVGNTTCAGDAAYALMDRIRSIAAGVGSGAGPRQASVPVPAQPDPDVDADVSALAALTGKLLDLVDHNMLARRWVDAGGPQGRLGLAASEPVPTAEGGQYARFVNGYLFQAPDGQVYEVAGRIGQRFAQLGGDNGVLGTPRSNEYPVPGGVRVDFGRGSLVFNEATGVVTTLGLPQPGSDHPRPPATPTPATADTPPAPAPLPAEPAQVPAPALADTPEVGPGEVPVAGP
ncbi:N-acetylmuramoyl-L-alanine amidase [Nocardia cyriacigeorgica]|uniref:N-acetylmuramoyl-L-alanine amidase n=1 Tax=Nocardia cyriacigeorgica TaxID=135487 RepID=UPI002B4B149D|nr:N-acetylmuramoyl-L-alanine amidase [Nocardia cyriacigeorgica]